VDKKSFADAACKINLQENFVKDGNRKKREV
jgi:hypothetical protein